MRIHRIQGIAANSHLIETDEALYLIDSGTPGHAATILRKIRALGRKPEDLRLAIVTHAHADHFGGLAEVQRAAGGLDVIVHPQHVEAVATGALLVSPGLNPYFRLYSRLARWYLSAFPLRGVHRVASAEHGQRLDSYGLPGRILHTPGHSDGDISLVLDDGSAFVGDTVGGSRMFGLTAPELPNMAIDTGDVLKSWGVLLDAGATRIYPAHGSMVTAEKCRPALARATSHYYRSLTRAARAHA